MAALSDLIRRHRNHFERNDKKAIERARQLFQGNAWAGTSYGASDKRMLSSMNLVYALTDSALSALLGPNPLVAAMARTRESAELAPAVTRLISYIFRANRLRRRAGLAIQDSVLTGRGLFKTGWNASEDRPIITVPDVPAVFFDLSVRDPADIRYWLEATVIPWRTFQERVRAGIYAHPKIGDVQPAQYPQWLRESHSTTGQDDSHDMMPWATVYEFYDTSSGQVIHYSLDYNMTLFEGELGYNPYGLFNLIPNGKDCRGVSEVQLIMPQQEAINDMTTLEKQAAYRAIPRMFFDGRFATASELGAINLTGTGSMVRLPMAGAPMTKSIRDILHPVPHAEVPATIKEFRQSQFEAAAFVSALTDYQRGRAVNVRTAAEMAAITAEQRNRLAHREGNLNEALEEVAKNSFWLCQRYMKTPRSFKLLGNQGWGELGHETMQAIDVDFDLVGHTPIRNNPAVNANLLVDILREVGDNPNIDMRAMLVEIFQGLGLPPHVIVDEKTAQQKEAQMQQAQQAEAMGGAAGGKPVMEGPPGGDQMPAAPMTGNDELVEAEQFMAEAA